MNKEQEKYLDKIICDSFRIRERLSAVLEDESKENNGINPHLAVFAVAGFVADVLDFYNSVFKYNLEEIFFSTIKNEMKINKEEREEKDGNQTDYREE